MAEQALDLDLRLRGWQHQAVGAFVPTPPASHQHTIVRSGIATHASPGRPSRQKTTAQAVEYIQHGRGRDGHPATLFDKHGTVTDPTAFVQRARGDTHEFRLIVSPHNLPYYFAMRPYIERLMAHMEQDLAGRPLDWVAAVHYETNHPHAHIVLRGRTEDGQPLYIKNGYLSHGMRHAANWVAAAFLGPTAERARTLEQVPEQGRTLPQTTPRQAETPLAQAITQEPLTMQEHQSTRTLTPAQQRVMTHLRAIGFDDGRLFGAVEAYPQSHWKNGTRAQDRAERQTIKRLAKAGVLEQPDPRRELYRMREAATQRRALERER